MKVTIRAMAKGGKVPMKHSDEREDRKLINKVLAEKGVKKMAMGGAAKVRQGMMKGNKVKDRSVI